MFASVEPALGVWRLIPFLRPELSFLQYQDLASIALKVSTDSVHVISEGDS